MFDVTRFDVTRFDVKRLARPAALVAVLALGACASATNGFVDEGSDDGPADTNLVKGLMTSMGAIDPREKPIEYKPRAPLVVPPKRALPAPQDPDAVLAKSNFPKNPEDVDRELSRSAAKDPESGKVWTPDQLARYRMSSAGASAPVVQADPSRRLTPEEMAGQFKVNQEAIARNKTSGRKDLTELPQEYRTPSPKAPVDPEATAEKSSWKPGWWPL